MRSKLYFTTTLLIGLIVVPCEKRCAAQSSAPARANVAAVPSESPAKNYFTDVLLTDQEGRQVRFYSDLLRGRQSSSIHSSQPARASARL